MKILRNVIDSVSRGHFEQDIPIKGHDELRDLGDALNTMTKRLQEKDLVKKIRNTKKDDSQDE